MSDVFERASVSLLLADFAVADQLGKLQMVGGGLQIVGRDHAKGVSAAFALVVSMVFPPELFNEQYVVRSRAGGHLRRAGRAGRRHQRARRRQVDAIRPDPAGGGAELPRQRGTPAGAAGPVPGGAVLQHRPAAAGRPGAGLARPDRRRLAAGLDPAVLRPAPPTATGAGMRLATWNINSVRARLDRIVELAGARDVDVLAIQETKIADDQFPVEPLAATRLRGCAPRRLAVERGRAALPRRASRTSGRASRACRVGASRPPPRPGRSAPSAAACGCGACTSPTAGRSATRTTTTSCEWLAALRGYGAAELAADPNRADRALRRLQHRPDRRRRLGPGVLRRLDRTSRRRSGRPSQALVDAGFTDVVRPFTPGPGVYTYWDYQQLRFAATRGHADRLRPGLAGAGRRVTGARIDREERKGKAPSDHAPVIVEFGGATMTADRRSADRGPRARSVRSAAATGRVVADAGARLEVLRPHAGDAGPRQPDRVSTAWSASAARWAPTTTTSPLVAGDPAAAGDRRRRRNPHAGRLPGRATARRGDRRRRSAGARTARRSVPTWPPNAMPPTTDPLFADVPMTPDVMQYHYDVDHPAPAGRGAAADRRRATRTRRSGSGRAAWGVQFHIETIRR